MSLLDRITKETTDISRAVLDMSWWLDPGETITGIVSSEIIQGMAGWSEAPYQLYGAPPPYDPTPLLFQTAVLDETSTSLVVFVEFGTPGLAYTCRFVLDGTSLRRVTVELGVQVTGVPPVQPLPVPIPASPQGATALSIMGGTLLGPLYLFEDPKYPTEAATKHYVDGMSWAGGPFMRETGGTFTGPVVMVTGATLVLAPEDPVDPLQATTKQYVDGLVATMSGGGSVVTVSPLAYIGPHALTVQITSALLIAAGTHTTALTIQTLPGDPGNVWLRLDGSNAAPNTGVLVSGYGGSRSFGAPGFPVPSGNITAITDGGVPQTVLVSGG